jgi:hypothetical protein
MSHSIFAALPILTGIVRALRYRLLAYTERVGGLRVLEQMMKSQRETCDRFVTTRVPAGGNILAIATRPSSGRGRASARPSIPTRRALISTYQRRVSLDDWRAMAHRTACGGRIPRIYDSTVSESNWLIRPPATLGDSLRTRRIKDRRSRADSEHLFPSSDSTRSRQRPR